MTAVDFAAAAAVVGVLVDAPASDTSISSLERRSGGMMATSDSDSGRGRGASSGSGGGPATTPNNNNSRGDKSHSALMNIVVPVVFVVIVVAFGLVFLWWLLRRLRRSRGRGDAWPLFMRSERKPELFEVSLSTRGKGRDGNSGWGSLQPASVDLISSEDRRPRERSGQVNMTDGSVGRARDPLVKKLDGGHPDFMVGKGFALSGKDVVEVRVAVLVAMPSPSRSTQMRSSDAAVVALPGPALEEGLFIGTAHTSF